MLRGRLRRFVATIGLITWIAGLVLPAIGGQHVPDLADVGETFLGILHPVPQVEPVHPSLGDEHCAICHLQRAVRGAALTAAMIGDGVVSTPSDPPVQQRALSSASLTAAPPRAPPLDPASTVL